uniref:Uncharacterized protein n=1 Tax=Plectus sambesii TaxID=2011161 RepID=A0A914V035_9BILA
MIQYSLFFTLLFLIDQTTCLQCNKGSNYAIKPTTCRGNATLCSTITTVDKYQATSIERNCDYDGYCSQWAVGINQCKTEPGGSTICCCNSDLCNDKPAKPSPNKCWSGSNNNKKSVACSSGFCSKIVLAKGSTMYECDTNESCPALGNTCSPSRSDGMTVCCCTTDLCNHSPKSAVIRMALLLTCLASVVLSH